jgi:Fur family peroxide stress response transcriptional regulator
MINGNTSLPSRPPDQVEAWCAAFRQRCRERGIRVTPQRLAVYRTLAQDLSHPSADTVHGRLRQELPTLSLATVYRVLESFEREGLVRRVSTPDGAGRFDANVRPHQHLVCRVCRGVSDFEASSLARIGVPRSVPTEFRAEELDIRIVGVCRPCQSKENDGNL